MYNFLLLILVNIIVFFFFFFSENPTQFILLHLSSLVIPYLLTIYILHSLFILFVPIMGRIGSEVNSDIVVGVLNSVGVIMLSSYLVSILCSFFFLHYSNGDIIKASFCLSVCPLSYLLLNHWAEFNFLHIRVCDSNVIFYSAPCGLRLGQKVTVCLSVHPSYCLLLNHWAEFNQTCYMTSPMW